jgi:predicted ester cyclase
MTLDLGSPPHAPPDREVQSRRVHAEHRPVDWSTAFELARSLPSTGGLPVRRTIVPLAIVLALVTGVVLAETRQVLVTPMATGAYTRSEVAAALVQQFYAATNDALATGDTGALEDVLAADFVDHAARPGTTPDRGGYLRSLLALREVAPALRLIVIDLVSERDRVAVRVGIEGAEGANFLGLPLGQVAFWAAGDVFRVEGGRIVERWGAPTGDANFDSLLAIDVSIAKPADKALSLERWTFAPEATETRMAGHGFIVLLVDAGTLTVQISSRVDGALPVPGGKQGTAGGRHWALPGSPLPLGPGDAVTVPPDVRLTVRNDGTVPAVEFAVVATGDVSVTESVMEHVVQPSGIKHEVLASGPMATLPTGEVTVAIGRVTLAPEAILPPHTVGAVELVAVEAGSMVLAGGGAWVTALPGAVARRSGEARINAGRGVRTDRGTEVGYVAAGNSPLEIVLVTLTPAIADRADAMG